MTDPYASALAREGLNVSRERAAHLAGVSTRTIDRLISAGDLVSITAGRKRLIATASLHSWLRAGLGA